MINVELEPFQENGIINLSNRLVKVKSVIGVAPTGSGKSVIIASITHRFLLKSDKDVAIFVHRGELASQIREALWDFFGILSQNINDETTEIRKDVRVYVCMVETFDRRSEIKEFISSFDNVGLIMVDECHINNFNKIFVHFYNARRIGFTATPLSATKKDPLSNYWQDIVIIATTKETIELNQQKPLRGTVWCDEYSLGKVKRSDLKIKGKEFDEDSMGEQFREGHQIENTLNNFLRLAYGKKTVVFNANIKHSIDMHQAFLGAGLNSRHLDSKAGSGYSSKAYRKDTFEWLKHTPDAILNNVGIATIGNDIKSLECVVTNKSTLSLPLFWQMRGRGGRPYQYPNGEFKKSFTHLDMGDNAIGGNMGLYDEVIDWEYIFRNPQAPRPSIAPAKCCPECGAMNYATARYCRGKKEDFLSGDFIDCGFLFPITEKKEYDRIEREVKLISSKIDVSKNIEFFSDRKEYVSYYETIKQVANVARKEISSDYLDASQIYDIYTIAYSKATEWHRIKSKKRYSNFKEDILQKTISNLRDNGFLITPEELQEVSI